MSLSTVTSNKVIHLNKANDKPIKLTNKVISNIVPRAKRFDIKDTLVTGLRVRVNPTGSKRFIAVGRVRATNQTRTLTIGDAGLVSLDDARVSARTFLGELQQGIDVTKIESVRVANKETENKIKNVMLADAMELYLHARQLKPSTVKGYRYEIPMYCADFINKPVSDISEEDICLWYLNGKDRPTAIDKAFRSLKAIMQYMVGTKMIAFNPCEAVNVRKMRYKIKPRTRLIETHNITKFIDAWISLVGNNIVNTVQGDFVLWLLMTGLRLDEARTLKWSDIDLDNFLITIQDTKNGKPHALPFTPLMSDLLDRRRKYNPETNPYIFPARIGKGLSEEKHIVDCRKTLDRICKDANTPTIRPHDLRRSFATILEELDISESNIKALMNHVDGTVTRKNYIQSANIEVKRSNLHKVACYIEEAATIESRHPEFHDQTAYFACDNAIRDLIYGTSDINLSVVKGEVTAKDRLNAMR